MILAVAVLPERLPAGALEVQAEVFDEHQVEAVEADMGGDRTITPRPLRGELRKAAIAKDYASSINKSLRDWTV